LLTVKIQGKGADSMIKYDRLWSTLKEREISQYRLIKDFGIDKAQLHRLRKNMVVKTMVLNNLCRILNCRIEDIMEYVPDEDTD
jgi:DNA-binding Xre family transcriptional regulator